MREIKMSDKRKYFRHGAGFSLIELLVVVGIISLLVGILAPAMRGFTKLAKNLKQKSQLHAIEIGLEFFFKDHEEYPPSARQSEDNADPDEPYVCGAQHLAEALLGRDLKGFDPKTDWYAPHEDQAIYANVLTKASTADEERKGDRRRCTSYMKDVDVLTCLFKELYDPEPTSVHSATNGAGTEPVDAYRSPFICGTYGIKKVKKLDANNNETVVKAGDPILYYRANTSSRLFKKYPEAADKIPDASGVIPYTRWVYNYEDNEEIIKLGSLKESIAKGETVIHNFDPTYSYTYTDDMDNPVVGDGIDLFYSTLTNPRVDTHDAPFNATSFVLITSGWDGIYGTKDDVKNFGF